MKKTIFLSASFVIFIAVGCKKDRVCECTAVDSSTGGTQTSSVVLEKMKKKKAEAECNTVTTFGTITTTCELQD